MIWPEIPADLNSLTATELRELARQIRAAAASSEHLSVEDLARVPEMVATRDECRRLAAAKDAQAALAAEEDEPEPVIEDPAAVEEEDEVVEEDAPARRVLVGVGAASTPAPNPRGRIVPEYLFATDEAPGKKIGDTYDSWAEMAAAAVAVAGDLRADSERKIRIAQIRADYPADRRLGDSDNDFHLNMAKFEPEEVAAALCAPATPYYGLACMNTARRPVFNSLPQFQAPRGKVTVMSSPTLADITDGIGIWTAADDANPAAVKDDCQVITCNDPSTYTIYGVYRCLTVKNLLAMTYPELVEAWLNRLAAAQARLAEVQLLNAMYTGATELNAPDLGYGGAVTITSTILNYLALYQETQRWDVTGNMEAWIPRWVMAAVKMDMVRRANTTNGFNIVPTDDQVNTMFRNAGVNPHWFIDRPSYATAIPAVGTSGSLNSVPSAVQILIAPPGKFALMDRGELNIGVTGNNIYRDIDSLMHNQFTYFFESFEGVVNTTSCPAHVLDIPVCWNGAQMAPVAMDCDGALLSAVS